MRTDSARFAIGALSRRAGCKVETIRYYERVGLLPAPARSAGGYRLYGTEHLKRLTFIRRARTLGFSIDEVRTLLKLADERERSCARARVVAADHLEDVRAKIADLKTMERVLTETVARCASGRGSDCPLIEALYRGEPDLMVVPFTNRNRLSSLRVSERRRPKQGHATSRVGRPDP